jgi:hypothetical protein
VKRAPIQGVELGAPVGLWSTGSVGGDEGWPLYLRQYAALLAEEG